MSSHLNTRKVAAFLMTTIAGPRGSGKTTELIRLCAEENAKGVLTYILVFNMDRADIVAGQAKRMGIDVPFPLTFSDLKGGLNGTLIRQILVDDADDLVRYFVKDATGLHVGAMTFTLDADQDDVILLRAELDRESGESPLPGFTFARDGTVDAQYVALAQKQRGPQEMMDSLLRRALDALAAASKANRMVEDMLQLARMDFSEGQQEVFVGLSEAAINDGLRQQKNARLQGDAVLQSARSAFSLYGIHLGTWMRQDLPVALLLRVESEESNG